MSLLGGELHDLREDLLSLLRDSMQELSLDAFQAEGAGIQAGFLAFNT